MPRSFILFNPASGHQGDPKLVQRLEAHAAAHSDTVTLHCFSPRDDLTDLCRMAAKDHDQVVAAGGDGTIAGVAAALRDIDLPMAVLPMGTFNFFARSIGVPLDLGAALDTLERGRLRPVAVGEVNGHIFLNNASLGIYPAILEKREDVYRRWGRSRLAAYASVVATITGFRRGRRMRVTVDGVERRRRSPLLFVAHSAYQLDRFGLPGGDAVRNGQFAVFLGKDVGRWGLLRHAARLVGRSMEDQRDFELLTGREIEVASTSRPLVAIDGERRRLDGPVRLTRRDDALQVRVPAETCEAAA